MKALLLILIAAALWLTWPSDHDDRVGFVVIMSALVPIAIPLWAAIAFWFQAVLIAIAACLLARE